MYVYIKTNMYFKDYVNDTVQHKIFTGCIYFANSYFAKRKFANRVCAGSHAYN